MDRQSRQVHGAMMGALQRMVGNVNLHEIFVKVISSVVCSRQ